MENGGRFQRDQIEQLKRLGGWAEKSSIVHLYIKRIVEKCSDTCGLLIPGKLKTCKHYCPVTERGHPIILFMELVQIRQTLCHLLNDMHQD